MKHYKIFLIVGLLIIAATALYFGFTEVYSVKPQSAGEQRSDLIARLEVFEFKKEFTDAEKENFHKKFTTHRDALNKALLSIEKEGEAAAPLLYWPLIYLGNLHRDVGAYDKAEAAYLYAQELSPRAFVPYANLGDLYYYNTKEYPRAVEYYLKAIEIDNPNLDTLYSNLHEIYRFHLADEQKAEQILIDGVKKYPNELTILALLAFYYRDTGQTDHAISRYKELLIKNPDSAVAKKALQELGAL